MNDSPETLRQFARAERRWEEVSIPGLRVDFVRWRLSESTASPGVAVTLSPPDVALGFKRLLGDETRLRRWAFVMLGSDRFFFGAEFESPAGDELLDALWDASFGETIGESAVAAIEALAASQGDGWRIAGDPGRRR